LSLTELSSDALAYQQGSNAMQISSLVSRLAEPLERSLNGHELDGIRFSAKPNSLDGRRYLVVEDEYLIAGELLMALEDAGAEVFRLQILMGL